MNKINNIILKVEQIIGSIMLIMIVLLVFSSAILRVFNMPIVWSVDMSQLLFTWISMLGADIALKYGSHMGVDLLVKKLPVFLRKIISLFVYLLCVSFLCFITYWGYILCVQNYLRTYATLQISYSFATVAVPFVSLLMIFTLLEKIIYLIKNWNNENILKERGEI